MNDWKCRMCNEPAIVPKLCYDHAKKCERCEQPYDPQEEHVCLECGEISGPRGTCQRRTNRNA